MSQAYYLFEVDLEKLGKSSGQTPFRELLQALAAWLSSREQAISHDGESPHVCLVREGLITGYDKLVVKIPGGWKNGFEGDGIAYRIVTREDVGEGTKYPIPENHPYALVKRDRNGVKVLDFLVPLRVHEDKREAGSGVPGEGAQEENNAYVELPVLLKEPVADVVVFPSMDGNEYTYTMLVRSGDGIRLSVMHPATIAKELEEVFGRFWENVRGHLEEGRVVFRARVDDEYVIYSVAPENDRVYEPMPGVRVVSGEARRIGPRLDLGDYSIIMGIPRRQIDDGRVFAVVVGNTAYLISAGSDVIGFLEGVKPVHTIPPHSPEGNVWWTGRYGLRHAGGKLVPVPGSWERALKNQFMHAGFHPPSALVFSEIYKVNSLDRRYTFGVPVTALGDIPLGGEGIIAGTYYPLGNGMGVIVTFTGNAVPVASDLGRYNGVVFPIVARVEVEGGYIKLARVVEYRVINYMADVNPRMLGPGMEMYISRYNGAVNSPFSPQEFTPISPHCLVRGRFNTGDVITINKIYYSEPLDTWIIEPERDLA